MAKILYILIGPKGSGKTHIGTQVHGHTDVHFLRVEPIWLALVDGENGWQQVEKTIDSLFQSHDKVMIESLGAGDGFTGMLANLERKYEVRMIQIKTELSECLKRVKSRDQRHHIPISDDQVVEYNEIAAKVEYDWYAIIDNNGPAGVNDILSMFIDERRASNN
jgi:guanylate kinase